MSRNGLSGALTPETKRLKNDINISDLIAQIKVVTLAATPMDISQVERDYEEFVKEATYEYYQNWAGLKEELNISRIFEKHSQLFTTDNLAAVKRARDASSGDDHRRFNLLFGSLLGTHLEQQVTKLTDEATTLETQTMVTIEGKPVPWRSTQPMLMNEENRERRGRIHRLTEAAVSTYNPILEDRQERLHEAAKTQGYSNYANLYSEIKSINYELLLDELKTHVKATDSLYADQLELALNSIHVTPEDANRHDILYLYRGKRFDTYFPRGGP